MDATATRIKARADEVRAHAARARRDVAGIEWRSTAADTFRGVADTDIRRLVNAAAELDDAAAALRAHAAAIRRRIEEIAAIERAVTGWFGDRVHDLASAADAVLDVVTNPLKAVQRVVEPWAQWPWKPHNLPGVGDVKWLDVAHDLRSRGVGI